MSDPFSRPLAPIDEKGQVAGDLQCLSCGYNLRGLSADGTCPECETPVGRSQYGNWLRYSNPDWVEQLASGMNWLVASIVLGIIGAGLIGGLTAARRSGTVSPSSMSIGFTIVMTILNLIAYWKITMPDPGQTETPVTARQVVRTIFIVNLALGLLAQLLTLSGQAKPGLMISAFCTLLGLVQTFALFTYAKQLAARIPNPKLTSQTTLVMWGMGITMAFAALTAIAAVVSPTLSVPTTSGPAVTVPAGGSAMAGMMFLGCFTGLGFLIFGIWSLLLIDRYRKALNEAAKQARSTWARDLAASANPQP